MNNDKIKPKHNTYIFSFLPPIIIHIDGAFYRTPTWPSLSHQQLLPNLKILVNLSHLFLICVFVARILNLSCKPFSTSTYPTEFKHVFGRFPLATCSVNNLQRTFVFSTFQSISTIYSNSKQVSS
jgi:hypothetical protein